MIQRYVQDPLAEMILAGEVKDGDRVKVAAAYDGLTFNGKIAGARADDAFESAQHGRDSAAGGRRDEALSADPSVTKAMAAAASCGHAVSAGEAAYACRRNCSRIAGSRLAICRD